MPTALKLSKGSCSKANDGSVFPELYYNNGNGYLLSVLSTASQYKIFSGSLQPTIDMYPSPHEQGKYASEGYPAGAVPDTTQGRHYPPPPSISSNMRGQVPGVARPWSTGICHCCDDPANCLITCFCPCITFGQIAEIVGRGSPSCAENGVCYGLLGLTGFACLFSCFYRSKLRAQYDLEEAPCVDCLVHFFCEACALCQEYRELKNRGFDLGIGWEANIDRQNRGITAAPTVEGGMRR